MGCCLSSPHQAENPNTGNDDHHDATDTNVNPPHNPSSQPPAGGTAPSQPSAEGTEPSQPPAEGTEPSQPPAERTTPFRRYTLAEIMAATDGFSLQNMLSKGGDELPSFVYKGRLHGRQQIAEEAIRVGRLRHRRIANLIGYCCEGDERLLVAEFMPKDTLTTHLFNHSLLFLDVI
ncbi:putative protein kinase RLK-Pelle-RLCK-XII-1 family [Dioscorea sansibarensis]